MADLKAPSHGKTTHPPVVTYDYVQELFELNAGVENLGLKILYFISTNCIRFFSGDANTFKSIVPSLLQLPTFDVIIEYMRREFFGLYERPYNHEIVTYIFEEIYPDEFECEILENNCKKILWFSKVMITSDILNYYLGKGFKLNAANYVVLAKTDNATPEFRLDCYKHALDICAKTKDSYIGQVIIGFSRCCVKVDRLDVFFPTMEECGVDIRSQMEPLAYSFTESSKLYKLFDYFLENYVDDYDKFVDMIFDEDICPDVNNFSMTQILARLPKYVDMNKVLMSKIVD
jgi:hypothetical protein